MDNLRTLNLEHNVLQGILALYDVMDTLTFLGLKSNKIREVPNNYFDNFTSLHTLTLSGNQIFTLPAYSVSALRFYQTFDLSWNGTETLECRTFEHMWRLEYVLMFNNELRSFPCFNPIHSSAHITNIDLSSSNCLSQITEDEVSNLRHLQYLDLNYNGVSNGSFVKAIPSLKVIKMANNRMTSLLIINNIIPHPIRLPNMLAVCGEQERPCSIPMHIIFGTKFAYWTSLQQSPYLPTPMYGWPP